MNIRKSAPSTIFTAALLVGGLSPWTWAYHQQPGKAGKLPDLTQACSKECPQATSNDEALKCVEDMEKVNGESKFKKQHKSCYRAHEKYEKMTNKQEAGSFSDVESSDSTH